MITRGEVDLDCSIEEVIAMREARKVYDASPSIYVPEDYWQGCEDSFKLLNQLEFDLFRNDYRNGTARFNDDPLRLEGESGVLLTAEHATDHIRIEPDVGPRIKKRDYGTGSLAVAAAKATNSSGLVSLGRQTGDANQDYNHPLKGKMVKILSGPNSRAHLSVHGMPRALAGNIRDPRGYSVQLGLGAEPSDATRTWVYDYVLPQGHELGLKIGVNDPHLRFSDGKPILSSDGTKIAIQIYAGGQNDNSIETTRAFSQKFARELGINDQFISAQIEISSVLRRHPEVIFPSERDAWVGAHAGYLFVKLAANNASLI